jgi:cell wall-associated NlpC family hydrolase
LKPDPRTTLARPDLACGSLAGILRAARFADAAPMQLILPSAAVRASPDEGAEQLDQILFGEVFDVIDQAGGYVWGQARRDGYVGYVEAAALSAEIRAPTHWIAALRAFAFEGPSIKARAIGPLSMNALVTVTREEGSLVYAEGVGWLSKVHLLPVGRGLTNIATVAQRYLGASYLWGGRDSLGLDCSGLVQQALYACGHGCPRDADQQALLGASIPRDALAEGNLVCWRGHIGMMLDHASLLHANAYHMAVAIEPLDEAVARITASAGEPIGFRRLALS